MRDPMIDRLVVLGGLGDLMRRYLAPALVELREAGELPSSFSMVASARHETSNEDFREELRQALSEHAGEYRDSAREGLVQRTSYVRADATDPEQVRKVLQPERGPAVVYLALPPAVFAPAVQALAHAGLPEGGQIVVEKPFGHDLPSARKLNHSVHRCLDEDAVFRIDHFLGMQTVQNILGLRFANRLLEPVWCSEHVEGVEIAWEETLTLEGRSFYDEVGAVRDVVQNHLLQVLCLVAMEPPASLGAKDLRDSKVDLLQSVRPPAGREAAESTVRGRYARGRVHGREVPPYAEEDGVDPERGTETFADLTLTVDNARWQGVPFRLRTGKALGEDRKEVAVRFRPVDQNRFTAAPSPPNELRIGLEERAHLTLDLNVNAADERLETELVKLHHDLGQASLSAYARVLLGALRADPTLSIRNDEVEAAWAIVDPILEAWAEGTPPLREYAAGARPGWGISPPASALPGAEAGR